MRAPEKLQEYCCAYDGYFFEWEKDGEDLLVVSDGSTVCYLDQLEEILELFAEQGAPAFGALMLAMIATAPFEERDARLNVLVGRFRALVVLLSAPDAPPVHFENIERHQTAPAFEFLHRLSSIPLRYRHGAMRLQVLAGLFEGSHNLISGKRIRSFIRDLRTGWLRSDKLVSDQPLHLGIVTADIRTFALLNARFPDSESLLQMLSAIPHIAEELPLEPETPVPHTSAPKDFVEELEQQPETFHVGALVRMIWSGLAIPFHNYLPSLQPLGGISDLSNKGQLDKLLISEYAADDLLFLSRLANGEALYINRETPPETERLQRILLLDASLQAWGTPRTMAYALLIAIARHPRTDIDCIAFAVGEKHYPINYTDTASLIDSLQRLDATLNAGPGLDSYLRTESGGGKQEIIFISSPQGLEQPPVQSIVREAGDIAYCISADEHGVVKVYKRRGPSMGHLQTFTLPLQALWHRPPAEKRAPAKKPEAPSLQPDQFPILFPAPRNARVVLPTESNVRFAVSDEHCVLMQTDPDKGWHFVRSDLPRGNCQYRLGCMDKEYLLLVHAIDHKQVHLFFLAKGSHAFTSLPKEVTTLARPEFRFDQDAFFLTDRMRCWKFALREEGNRPEVIITEVPDANIPPAAYPDAEKYRFPVSGTVKKKLRLVGITQEDRLFINTYEFCLRGDNEFRFCTLSGQIKIWAVRQSGKQQVFADGSSIEIHAGGMLQLKSADPAIGSIYIPAVVDVPIGAATDEFYAGSNYFYRGGSGQDSTELSPSEFYEWFIAGFINHITRHAASA